MTIQEKVIAYLAANNIKKKDFAESIGITPIMLSHWLNGRTSLPKDRLSKIKNIIN